MWKLLIKLEGQDKFLEVYGMGMTFPGFHVMEQAASFMLTHLDKYVISTYGKLAEIKEVQLTFQDNEKVKAS